MPKANPLNNAIIKGMRFLKVAQCPDGSFYSLSSPDKVKFTDPIHFPSVFSTTLILLSLSEIIKIESVKEISDNAAKFLLSQKSENFSFNYWARNSKEYKRFPYPDDLDDTFCALSAIYKYDSKLINGSVLGQAVQLLTSLEIEEGGPYRTWLVDDSSAEIWKDVDIAVNANIAYFLSLIGVRLPNLIKFINEKITDDKLISPYYPIKLPVIYFISRFYKGKNKNLLKKLLNGNEKNKESCGNPLDTALTLLSNSNLKFKFQKRDQSLDSILSSQNSDGSWEVCPFYTGVNPKKDRLFYAGSKALTTAFCLQALSRYSEENKKSKPVRSQNTAGDKISTEVYKYLDTRFKKSGNEVYILSKQMIRKISKIDDRVQISRLTDLFTRSLDLKGVKITGDFITRCGAALMFGWIAYTIYDDIWDESPKPLQLALANISLRELTHIYENLIENDSGFVEMYYEIMNGIDESNTFEIINWRVKLNNGQFMIPPLNAGLTGNYRLYADRALGHGLGPLAVLFKLGFEKNSSEVQSLIGFFRNFLIAKQLNDDAHDFETDLKMGHFNPLIFNVLKKYIDKNGINKIDLNSDLQKLQSIFWYETIVEICNDIHHYSQTAMDCLTKIPIINKPELLGNLLIPVRAGADEALAERAKALNFLEAYSVH